MEIVESEVGPAVAAVNWAFLLWLVRNPPQFG